MLAYAARRLIVALPVLFGIILISFVMVQIMPGDPLRAMTSPENVASPEYLARRRAELGLDDPMIVQFMAWVREVFQGNLGYSFHRHVPVTQMIADRLIPTAALGSAALVAAVTMGTAIGVVAALKQNSWFDYLSAVCSMAAISIPNFFLGLILIYVFAIKFGLLPTGGTRTLAGGDATVSDSLRHLLLPVSILAVNMVGPYVRFTRQGMLEVLRQDYMVTALAKGTPRRGVLLRHGLRNVLVPLTAVIALNIPVLLTGVLIIEVLFSWPGLGRLTFEAISARDYPVIIAMVFVSAVLVMIFNLLADLLAALLDPRIRL